MGRLAKVMQGQSQPGLKAYKRGGLVSGDATGVVRMKKGAAPAKTAACKCGGKPKK